MGLSAVGGHMRVSYAQLRTSRTTLSLSIAAAGACSVIPLLYQCQESSLAASNSLCHHAPPASQGATASTEQAAAAVAAAALIARKYAKGEEPDCEEAQPEWLLGVPRVRFRGEANVAALADAVLEAHWNASTCPLPTLAQALVRGCSCLTAVSQRLDGACTSPVPRCRSPWLMPQAGSATSHPQSHSDIKRAKRTSRALLGAR